MGLGTFAGIAGTVASTMLERLLQLRAIRFVKIYVHSAGSSPEVVFDIFVHGTLSGRVTTSPEELGLPMTYQEALHAVGSAASESCPASQPDQEDQGRVSPAAAAESSGPRPDDRFKVPDYILTALEYVLVESTSERTPVWLLFDLPIGYLPLIPWEARLQPTLKAPVLRLPPMPLKPLMPRESLDIVLCLGRPVTPSGIADVARRLQGAASSLGRRCRLWIFGDDDAPTQLALNKVKQLYETATLKITIPDPRAAPDYQVALVSGSTRLQNPWLIWMCHALGGKSADLAHFIVDGRLAEPQSCLLFPPSVLKGVDRGWGQFVPVEELSAFVTEIGATCVGFSTPPDAHGRAATRMVQEHLARLRPGPIALQNAQADSELTGITQTLGFLYAKADGPPPASTDMTLFCHPSGTERSLVASALSTVVPEVLRTHVGWAASPLAQSAFAYLLALTPTVKRGLDIVANSDEIRRALEQFTIAPRASTKLTGQENKPAWLAKTQRTLEVAASRLYETGAQGEVRQGAEDALKEVASIAAKYASDEPTKKRS